jgi:probable rRNA maturation factor
VTILEDHPTRISGALEALVRDVLADQGYPDRVEVTVHTVGSDIITRRNADAFGKEQPTDVLSFPLENLQPGIAPHVDPQGPPVVLGDVFIAPSVVAERASQHGFDSDAEMALMTIHGVLHLMGYDHVDDADAEVMEAIETRVLSNHGFGRR